MDYVQIVKLVFIGITLIMTLLLVHFAIFAIVGLFARKKFPKTDEKLKYGIIIPARNEAAVVGNLIKSVYKNKYPQDKLHVFVIAHNCTDDTAKISRELGATVYEYNNPEECTMGYAFRYLFDRIREDYGVENYDGFFLFNADNVLADDYFDKMNDAFVANGKDTVITSFRNSKNFGSNVMSAMYGIYFVQGCRYESRGRTYCGCSTRVQGTGYVIPAEIVKDGWNYVTLTEDWEFSADQIIRNRKIVYCDEAVFYDEQPTTTRIMLRQRLRWAKGHLLVCLTRYGDLLKGIFTPKKRGGGQYKGSLYDMSVNILPVCIISFVLFAAQAICLAFAPLMGYDSSQIANIWIYWAIGVGFSMVCFYLVNFIAGIVILIAERKRIKNVSGGVLFGALILWPIFVSLSVPLEIMCLFVKVGWKAIPHKDTTTFEQVNDVAATDTQADAVDGITDSGEAVATDVDGAVDEPNTSVNEDVDG